MKVVLLAGGFGTRISEYTKTIPKPLVKIRNKEILSYIIDHLRSYGLNDIIIASGYKHAMIKKFFLKKYKNCNIKIINSGTNTEIIKRISEALKFSKKDILIC